MGEEENWTCNCVVKSSADAEELLKEETPLAVAFLDDFEVDGFLCSIKRI
jgi:hypothetical protein